MSETIEGKDTSFETLDNEYISIDSINSEDKTEPKKEDKKSNPKKQKKFKSKINKEKKVTSFIYRWRKLLIIGAFLLFILITIPTAYGIEYARTKVTPFESESYETLSSESSLPDFDFTMYCSQYGEPDDYEDSKELQFQYTINNFDETNFDIKTVKLKLAIGDSHWTNNYYEGSYSTLFSDPTAKSSKSSTYTGLSSYKYSYPAKKWGLVKIEHPTVYALLTYTKTKVGGQAITYTYMIKYSYSEWFKSGTTKII